MIRRRVFRIGVFLMVLLITTEAFAGLGDYFVETDWLDNNREKVKIVDVRNPALYLLGHIEGAVNIDRSEFLSTRHGTKSLVPTVKEFELLMDRYGITPEMVVVAYSEDNNPYMARFVWTLRFHGHERSYLLDGGYDKWVTEGRSTSLMPGRVDRVSGYRVSGSADIRAGGDYVLARLNNPLTFIWDTRRKSEFTGTEVRAARGGHIPGAVHLEWLDLLRDEKGVKVLKSEKEIQMILEAAGISRNLEIIAHCQTGIRSSYATLVLLSLGYRAKNYDGSWIEWANCHNFPVEGSSEQAGLEGRHMGL